MSESRDGLRSGGRMANSNIESPTTENGGQFDASSSADGIATSNGNKSTPRGILNIGSSPSLSKTSPSLARPLTIDPLSQHILKRTNTENTIPQKLRNAGLSESTTAVETGTPTTTDIGQYTPEITRSDSNLAKEKKKGVSFLSRFNITGKKKDQLAAAGDNDEESEFGDNRIEGMEAKSYTAFSANGFVPQHKEPPRYIKVRSHNKNTKEFNRIFLAQEFCGTSNLANSEKDSMPTSTTFETLPQNSSSNKLSKAPPKPSGAVWATAFSLDGKYLAVAGHEAVIRVYAVLSTHEEREAEEEALNTSGGERLSAPVFRKNAVLEFHGHTSDVLDLSWSKNNFLLSSSMDKSIKLWHVSRPECLVTFKHKDFATSIAFHPTDDRFFLCGSLDSVLRLWSIPDKAVAFHTQLPDMITAINFSPDGKTAIAGTFNGICFFYETEGLKYQTQILVRSSRGKNSKGSKITGLKTAILPHGDPEAETKVLITSNDSRIRLYNLRDKSLQLKFKGIENTSNQIKASFSQDGKWIICGSEDRRVYIFSLGAMSNEEKEKTPVEYFEAHSSVVTAAIFAPEKTRQILVEDPIFDLCNPPPVTLLSRHESSVAATPNIASEKRFSEESLVKKPEESPAYVARSSHPGGNIIVTADYSGCVKIFRQDCAYQKRQNELEILSNFSRKMRTNSIRTRHSNHSRRSSIGGSDGHILSWRSGVEKGAKSTRSERSVSPGKAPSRTSMTSITNSQNNQAQISRQQPYASTPLTTSSSITTASPPQSLHQTVGSKIGQPPTPSFTFTTDNPLKLDSSGRSYQFWNRPKTQPETPQTLRPPISGREFSQVSKLSSEEASLDDESDGEALSCKKCGGKNFKARKVAGKAKLVCTKCFATVE